MKSHLGGQDRAQFPGTVGLRETLELNRESCCHGHKSRKERDQADIQGHATSNKAFG